MTNYILYAVVAYTVFDFLYNINVMILAKKAKGKKNDVDINILMLKTIKRFFIDAIIIFLLWCNHQ